MTFEDVDEFRFGDNCYKVRRTWTATDACNLSSTASSTTEAFDNLAPVLSGVPVDRLGDSFVPCDEPLPAADVTALDNCLGAVPVSLDTRRQEGRCTHNWQSNPNLGNHKRACSS